MRTPLAAASISQPLGCGLDAMEDGGGWRQLFGLSLSSLIAS